MTPGMRCFPPSLQPFRFRLTCPCYSFSRLSFPSQGGRDAVAEAQRAFTALGAPDNLVVDEATWHHGYTKPNREGLYNFFCKFLPSTLPHPNCSVGEIAVPEFSHEALWATTTGQVCPGIPASRDQRRIPLLVAQSTIAFDFIFLFFYRWFRL